MAKFTTLVSSDSDYEKLVAEVNYGGRFVALISQEGGPESLLLEFAGCEGIEEEQVCRKVPLDGFLSALEQARQSVSQKPAPE